MAARVKLTTKGFDAWLEAIAEAGKDIGAVTDRALAAGAQALQDGMKRRVPKDTRNLEEHIKIKGPERDGNYHSIEVGVIHDRAYTDPDTARYGAAQEYGTSSMGAQSYIRPTIDSDKRKAAKIMREVFEKESLL